ncbi:MAG: PEP-CTERM sorting domain-containing protein [Armatimonadetes bacterium]|nr:PEP-CTERM sorting domain-containing protein [Armatimonadota bacterium]
MNKSILVFAVAIAAVAPSQAVVFYNAASHGDNGTVQSQFYTDLGIAGPSNLEDFESYGIGTNMNGVTITGGLTFNNTGTGALEVRGPNQFGGASPNGQRGLWHNESPWLELSFATPVQYVGGVDIDHTAGTVRVTTQSGATSTFSLDSTSGANQDFEFWGLRADVTGEWITKVEFDVGGDSSWGIDDVQYGPVPEPTTLGILALSALALKRRKKN